MSQKNGKWSLLHLSLLKGKLTLAEHSTVGHKVMHKSVGQVTRTRPSESWTGRNCATWVCLGCYSFGRHAFAMRSEIED